MGEQWNIALFYSTEKVSSLGKQQKVEPKRIKRFKIKL